MTSLKDRLGGYYNPKLEIMSAPDRREYLSARLRDLVRQAYDKSPETRARFDGANLSPDRIMSPKDIEDLPILRAAEDVPEIDDPPPGEDRWRPALYAAGLRPGDVVLNAFNYQKTPVAAEVDDSLRGLGCFSVPAGVGTIEVQAGLLVDLQVEAYVGAAGLLSALARQVETMGLDPRQDLNLQAAFTVGKRLTEPDRQRLEDFFGLKLCQGYGTTALGCLGYECRHLTGLHWPDEAVIEVVDPDSGRSLGPGEVGEVAVTAFASGRPLIRAGIGDLAWYTDEPCPCGRTSPRLAEIVGRV